MKHAMTFGLMLAAATVAWTGPAEGKAAGAGRSQRTAVNCNWPVGPFDSARTLMRRFGRQARMADIGIGEGETERGVVLYPGDPRRRMEVLFWGDTRHAPRSVQFVNDRAPWTVAGIRIGDTLESVRQRNGQPVSMQQFNADYSGTVNSFNGGMLETVMGQCEPSIVFAPAIGANYPNSLVGDGVVDSDHPDMPKARAHVSILGVHFPPPTDQ